MNYIQLSAYARSGEGAGSRSTHHERDNQVITHLARSICGAGFLASSPPRDGLAAASCALTFWICVACSLRVAAKTSIPFCCCAIVAWCFVTVDFNWVMVALRKGQ